MILPSLTSLKETWRRFALREGVSWKTLINPRESFRLLSEYRYLHFFATGGTGVALNLFVTWGLTRFVFGLPNYFTAYLFGIAVNLAFNFTLYTLSIFKTETRHAARLAVFVAYSLVITYVQATIVKFLTPAVGLRWYLLVIAGTILVFSTVNFFIFKLSLFREKPRDTMGDNGVA